MSTETDTVHVVLTSVLPYGPFSTVITFEGGDENGNDVLVAVDHRPARDLLRILEIDGDVEVEVEGWQILRTYKGVLK